MRRPCSFSLFHKQMISTPITSFVLFLSYIVVTPLMIGFEKSFSCHSHLGPIRIPPLFPFLPEPFPRNEKEDGTLELYYLSAYLPKILLLQLAGHRVIQISRVFRGFPMLQLPYQFDRSGMDRLNIPLGSPVLTLLCGIHSRSALGMGPNSSGWNSSQNPTTSPTSLPPFPVPLLKQNGFMFFHRLVIPLRSYLLIQFRSRLVHKIEWPLVFPYLSHGVSSVSKCQMLVSSKVKSKRLQIRDEPVFRVLSHVSGPTVVAFHDVVFMIRAKKYD